jgi:hypothetical protein
MQNRLPFMEKGSILLSEVDSGSPVMLIIALSKTMIGYALKRKENGRIRPCSTCMEFYIKARMIVELDDKSFIPE